MTTKLPVYSDTYGYHQINVWAESGSGNFRRTAHWLMPHLLINFDQASESLGQVLSPMYDRREHPWGSPTAYFHAGRPMSVYHFLRTQAQQRRIMVLTTMNMSGRAWKFDINELRFKNNVATPVKALTARNFLEEIEVFMDPEEAKQSKEARRAGIPPGAESDDFDAFRITYHAILPRAEAGDPAAQFALGHQHEHGEGVKQSYSEAAAWYVKAARQGHTPAQARLGGLYAAGKGVPQDQVEAYFWICMVSENGIPSAARLKERLAGRLSRTQLATGEQLIREWRLARVAAR